MWLVFEDCDDYCIKFLSRKVLIERCGSCFVLVVIGVYLFYVWILWKNIVCGKMGGKNLV